MVVFFADTGSDHYLAYSPNQELSIGRNGSLEFFRFKAWLVQQAPISSLYDNNVY